MTPDAQRIAIAEALGWRLKKIDGIWPAHYRAEAPDGREWSRIQIDELVPDFLNSLDAMHEAEKMIVDHTGYAQQLGWLVKPCNTPFFLLHATAAQRAEAFLRTLSLWQPQPAS